MKKVETLSSLDTQECEFDEIEKERQKLIEKRDELMDIVRDRTISSEEYIRIKEINNILNVKMITLSAEDRKVETEMALKEISEQEFNEISKSFDNEDKYIQLLKGYEGYKNEWKLYTRTNVDCNGYYFQKAKFLIRNYYNDYQYFTNLQFRGKTKLIDKNLKTHCDMLLNKKRLKKYCDEEFTFRLENTRLLTNAYMYESLSPYAELIYLYSFAGFSQEQLASYKEISTGSVENDLKNLYKSLATVLKINDENYILGKDFLEQKNIVTENVEKKELITYIGQLEERVKVLKKFTPNIKNRK